MSTIGTRQLEGMWRSARGRTPGADPVAVSEKEWAVISESGDLNERYAVAQPALAMRRLVTCQRWRGINLCSRVVHPGLGGGSEPTQPMLQRSGPSPISASLRTVAALKPPAPLVTLAEASVGSMNPLPDYRVCESTSRPIGFRFGRASRRVRVSRTRSSTPRAIRHWFRPPPRRRSHRVGSAQRRGR
jgi:hypothetical protein